MDCRRRCGCGASASAEPDDCRSIQERDDFDRREAIKHAAWRNLVGEQTADAGFEAAARRENDARKRRERKSGRRFAAAVRKAAAQVRRSARRDAIRMNAETTKDGGLEVGRRVKGNVDLSVVGDGYPDWIEPEETRGWTSFDSDGIQFIEPEPFPRPSTRTRSAARG